MARPKEHKPETILAAAMALFKQDGVSVSTAQIAKAAGVSNGTLFNYFPTKQELIDALYVSIKHGLGDAVGELDPAEPMQDRMRQIWNRWIEWAGRNRDAHHVVTLLHQAGLASEDAQKEGEDALLLPMDVLIEAMDSGILVDLPIEYLGALIQHQVDQAIVSELDHHQAGVAFTVLWNGIAKPTDN